MIVSDTPGRNDRQVSVLAVDCGGIRENARVTAEGHVTYRSVLRNREFSALLLSQTLSTAGDQLARIAVAVLVFDRTGSAFAASATYAVSYLTYLLGGPVLSAISDRNPRITVMITCDLLRAPLILALCLNDLPLWSFFAVLGIVGALAPPFDSARSALQPDLLAGERYVVGNALMNLVIQGGQVLGFLAGGALVSFVSVRGALALDAATFLVSAGVVMGCVRYRPAAQDATERSSLLRDTASGFRLVAGHQDLKRLLGFALLGSAAIIAPEGLAIPVSKSLGGGALEAGILTAAVPAGYLIGSTVVLRFRSDRRTDLLPVLVLVACVPLLLTPLVHSLAVVAALWFIAGAGGCINLVASSAYMQICPREFRARAYGVAITSLNAVQGLVLLGAGVVAGHLSAAESVAALAGGMLLLFALMRAFSKREAQEKRDLVRWVQGDE
jgi:MFS family permease